MIVVRFLHPAIFQKGVRFCIPAAEECTCIVNVTKNTVGLKCGDATSFPCDGEVEH